MCETLIKLTPPGAIGERIARWNLPLEPPRRVQLAVSVTPRVEGRVSRAQVYEVDHHPRQRRANFARWEAASTSSQSDNDVLDGLRKTAIGEQLIIAAGIPGCASSLLSVRLPPAFRNCPT